MGLLLHGGCTPGNPFEVARMEGSMVIVGPWSFVYAVVEKVIAAWARPWSDSALSVRNTKAKPGPYLHFDLRWICHRMSREYLV